jgi:F-type H+-transporting ATPase subunit delta
MSRAAEKEELMLSELIAERYAKALLRAAGAEKALAEVGAQAADLAVGLKHVKGAASFLEDPLSEASAKLAVFEAAFDGGLHPLLRSFLQTVLEHKRERFLPLILARFLQMRDEAEGRVQASLGTARPLAAEERRLLEAELGRRLGRQVILEPYTDKDLLGGAVLRLGDRVYDASLRGRLQRLARLLSEGAFPPKRASKGKAAGGGKKNSAKNKTVAKKAALPSSKVSAKGGRNKAKASAGKAAVAKSPAKSAAKTKKASAKSELKAKGKPAGNAAQALAAKLLKREL